MFLPEAVIVRTCGGPPAVYGVDSFIAPRQELLSNGTLTDFREWEVSGRTEMFGDIAQHFCLYAKAGVQHGTPFTGRGMKTLQFVRTPAGWRISAAAWDDERDGLAIDPNRSTVRPAVAEDVPELRAVASAAYEGYVPRMGRRPAPMTADYGRAVRDGQVWVAVADDMLVGLVVLVPREGHLLLENIAVSPSAQGQGVGGRLLAFAEDHARRRGLSQVRLYTNEAMTENLAYYPRHGYIETHRAEQNGFRRVFFTKVITA